MTTATVNYGAILAQGSKQKQARPPIVVLHADKGVGKTTFASQFPNVALLAGEDGAGAIIEHRWPSEGAIQSWDELLTYTRAMAYGKHDFKTLVVDTCGPLSTLCLNALVKESNKDNWEKMGWGKEEALVSAWRVWLSLLETCRNKRGMTIILLMHSIQKGINDATLGERYYAFLGDVHDKLWDVTFGWADLVLYAAREMALHTPEHGKTRAFVKEPRWLHANADTGFKAKTRIGYRLPAKMQMTEHGMYERFMSELRETPDGVRDRIGVLVKQIGQPEVGKMASEFIKQAGESVEDLRLIETKLKEMVQ